MRSNGRFCFCLALLLAGLVSVDHLAWQAAPLQHCVGRLGLADRLVDETTRTRLSRSRELEVAEIALRERPVTPELLPFGCLNSARNAAP